MLFNLLTDDPNQGGGWVTYVILGVVIAAVIGLLIWQSYSNKKRQKEANEMLTKLQKGDKIKTIGGVCGYLVEVNEEENTIVIETGNDEFKSYVKFDRNAIYQTGSMATETAPAQKAEEVKPVEEVKVEEPVKVEEVKAEENVADDQVNEEVKVEEVASVEETAPAQEPKAKKAKKKAKAKE